MSPFGHVHVFRGRHLYRSRYLRGNVPGKGENLATPAGMGRILVGVVALLGVFVLAIAPVRGATRTLLSIEGITVVLIVVVAVMILIRLVTGAAPQHRTVDFSVFTVAPGTGTSAVFLGVVFRVSVLAGL